MGAGRSQSGCMQTLGSGRVGSGRPMDGHAGIGKQDQDLSLMPDPIPIHGHPGAIPACSDFHHLIR